MDSPLLPGRDQWAEVHARLHALPLDDLSAEELDALGEAAWWRCHTEESLAAKQQAHLVHLETGQPRQAAMSAWWLFYGHLYWGERSQATGWLRRMRRHLQPLPDGVEHGYLAFAEAELALYRGDFPGAEASARRATDLGERFDDRNAMAMGLQVQGRVLIAQGALEEGLALLDESMTLVVAGEISEMLTGSVYCSVIHTCRDLVDLPRAVEWTEAMRSWYEQLPPPTPYHGLCRVYRGEVLGLCGQWGEAEHELARACDQLLELRPRAAAEAFYATGELYRRRGQAAEAAAVFARAQQLGRDPQPGRSLLLLAQGRHDAAAAGLRTSLTKPSRDPWLRARLREAQVEVSLAVGDLPTAAEAVDELDATAQRLRSGWLHAVTATARGTLLMAQHDPPAAVTHLRSAATRWAELALPYEQARARTHLGLALRAIGDDEAGQIELTVTRDMFRSLGAESDERRVAGLMGELPAGLTERELQVLRLVAAGHTNHEIADQLVLSEHTVRRHLQNIFLKIGVSSRTAASAFAFRHHLL